MVERLGNEQRAPYRVPATFGHENQICEPNKVCEPQMTSSNATPRRRPSTGPSRNPATRQAILNATRQILSEKGYGGISFEEIARRAGAGKPTIYRWWPTKADLFIEVYGADKDQEVPVPDTGNLAEDLTSYTTALWSFWRSHPAASAFKGLIAEAQSNDAARHVLVNKFLPHRTEPIRLMLRRAVQRNEIGEGEVESRVQMWVGFSWYHLLAGDVGSDMSALGSAMSLLAS